MQPTRQEFLHISGPEKILFYVLIFGSIAYMCWQVYERVVLWKQGKPVASPPLREAIKGWIGNLLTYVLAQKKVRSSRKKSGAPMHLLIFYGFLSLFVATTLLAIATYGPYNFHKGGYYLAYEVIFDFLGLLFVVGIGWAFVRRALALNKELGQAALREEPDPRDPTFEMMRRMSSIPKIMSILPGMASELAQKEFAEMELAGNQASQATKQNRQRRRYPLSHDLSDVFALGLLFLLGVTGYWLEAARISVNPQGWDNVSFVGYWWSRLQGPYSPDGYKFVWWFHVVWVAVFFAVLPKMRIRHILMAILTTAGYQDKPMGKLRTISMEEVEETEQIGVKEAKDYSRWNLMSLDACMECGRCTEVCPAWNVGKILNPKQVVQDIRSAMKSGQPVAAAVSEEALWQCTTCNACVEACPVLIRHVDMIVDVRRNLVSEGMLSGSAATMLRQTASTGNAWGQAASNREDWMKGLDIPLCRDGVEFDILFWVGCAGATDPGAIKTTKAVAQLLKKAGVKFACLGKEEACTGDPARRVGEEFLFQDKATQNVSVFERYGVKKVVTACPHCMNTFKNEYGDFGATLEVFHHSQLLQNLVRSGDLVGATFQRGEVVLHDPCYLSRVNGEVEAQREVLSDKALDPKHHGVKTLCCGAGGGRMWMEEPADQRPSNRRAEELVETGAKTVAVACPFCRIMLGDSLKQVKPDEEIRLVDIAEMLQDANVPAL